MKLTNSENFYTFNKLYTPCGSQTLSKMPNRYVNGVYPKLLESGKGATVTDVDGNVFVDLIAGLGAISLGYCDMDVNDAVIDQLQEGVSYSLPTMAEGVVARQLTTLVPHTDMWKFGKNGTDGDLMAVRCARAYTKRDKILTVGYNGCADIFESHGVRKAGMFDLSRFNTRAVYNDIKSFDCLKSGRYACVLLEPMVFDYPTNGFFEELRELCTKTETLLIFDEVVTGGRFITFTAQQFFKVIPDLTILGKGIANGFPLSAVGGKRSIMETFERDDFFASGTFGGECVSLAAGYATLAKLPGMNKLMESYGCRIKYASEGICKGYPTRLTFDFATTDHKALFMQEMALNGVLVGYTNFVMANMTELELETVIIAIKSSLKKVKKYWLQPTAALRGDMPVEALRLRKQ